MLLHYLAKQAINDKLQGSVATYFRYGEVVNKYIEKSRRVEKKFKIGEYLAKLQARAWLSHALCAPGQHTANAPNNHVLACKFAKYSPI